MKATQQNPCYHAEGNVYKHTLMVLENVLNLDTSWNLSEEEKSILYWAAIVHDIGKPEVTKWEDGRYHAHGHEKAGVPIARTVLLEHSDLSIAQRKKVLDLVRYHSIPLKFALKEAPIEDYKKMALRTDIRLMGIFAHCDLKGRICKDMSGVNKILSRFNDEIVPEVEASLGSFAEIQALYESANLNSKNSLWEASRFTDFRVLEQMIKGVVPKGKSLPVAICYLPVGVPCEDMQNYLAERFPNVSQVSIDKQSSQILMQEVLNQVVDQEELLIFADFTDTGFRQAWSGELRKRKIEVRQIVFEKSLERILAEVKDPWQYRELSKRYHRLENPHPWEAHSIEYVQL